MFLKSLTLKGFKSFAEPTTLDFEPGVTVVVGPNGSGKSNVVDAVAWVLGAQGPRSLRSTKMEDVIFAGTPSRPALGRAEVSLTIDNGAGLLPIEFSEVTFTRTLFRTGDSEYAINRVPCRLLDIQELLSDTGVGRQQHVIVSQGNLDTILNSRPEDRRAVIEEAAGVLKYRRRKEKSERRLEATEASLVRLQDLLREVRRQLRPLERQADAARRHDTLMAELDGVRRHLAGHELAALELRLAATSRDRAELSRADEQVRAALARLDADVISAEAELSAARVNEQRADLGELVSRAEGLRAKAEGLSALLAERRRSIERDAAFSISHDVIASLEAESASLSEQLDGVGKESAELGSAATDVAAAEERLAAETADVEAAWHEAGPVTADPAAEARGELAALGTAVERGRAELRRLDARAIAVSQRAGRMASEAIRWQRVLAEAEEAAPRLAREADEAARQLAAAEAALVAAEDARRRADEARHRWSARDEALAQALDEARARAGAQRLSDVPGVVGALLEVVEVDDGWGAAFEAAAGEFLAAVVVEGQQAARRSLEELHRQAVTGAVAAAPDVGFSAPVSPPPADLPAGTEALRGHVRARLPGVNALLDRLLASAVVVPGTWEDALAVARTHPALVVVTRAGDRYANGLWRAGQGGTGATGAALEEARAAATAAAAVAHSTAARATEAGQEAEAARDARTAAARAVDANDARRAAAADAVARARSDAGDARAEADAVAAQQVDTRARLARDERRTAELEELLPELEAAAAEEAGRQLAARAARARLADQAAAVAALRRDFEVRAAGLEERRSLLLTRKQHVDERLAGNVAERERAGIRRERLRRDAKVLERLASLVRDRRDAIEALLVGARRERREEAEEIRTQTDRLEQLRRERNTAERHLTELRERSSRVDLEETEARVRLQHLTESVRRDLDCEPDAVRGAPVPELPPGTSATSRRAELERELRLMGPINPLALEEYAALQERHQFLEEQLEDVRAGRRELTKLIRAIDAEIEDVLRAAWLDVAENFETLFSTLFPGGQGRLRLTDPDDMLETGIEVEARPSGKNVRRLSLLSGGERSLVALAFLFAVFRSRPSPFYLMDEVEAALDDVNLHRFLDLVHEFRDEAQLVIVSHQRRTMEAADSLYGVTMPPGGSSRVITERVAART